jgi:cytochrome c oxidase subunit 3
VQSAIRRAGSDRVSPLRLGMLVFLASDLMLFAGLFAAYFTLRAETDPWPPADVRLEVARATIATAILVASSFTLLAGMRSKSVADMNRWIAVTVVLGLAFLGLQLVDWLTVDFSVSTHAYGTLFFAMTGFHGAHVLAGILLMLVVLGRARQGAYRDGDRDGPEAVGYFWHFVDVVWIGLWATLFLLQ